MEAKLSDIIQGRTMLNENGLEKIEELIEELNSLKEENIKLKNSYHLIASHNYFGTGSQYFSKDQKSSFKKQINNLERTIEIEGQIKHIGTLSKKIFAIYRIRKYLKTKRYKR